MSALALVAALATGCGGHGGAGSTDAAVDLSKLDVGSYDTTPHPFPLPKNPDAAGMYEGERLGRVLPLPSEIATGFDFNTVPYQPVVWGSGIAAHPSDNMLHWIWPENHFAEDGAGFIGGFVTSASNDRHLYGGTELTNAVLIFGNESQASAAAKAFAARALAEPGKPSSDPTELDPSHIPNEVVPIPKYPAAQAQWRPGIQEMSDWLVIGRYVVYTHVRGNDEMALNRADRASLIDLTTRSLDAEVVALPRFTPTFADQLQTVSPDQDGMLLRALGRPETSDRYRNPPGVYDAHAALNFSENQATDRTWFDRDGVDRYAVGGADLYRTRDAAAALDARGELGGSTRGFTRADGPNGLPAAICRKSDKEHELTPFTCAVAHGRYAAVTWSDQLIDAQQRISAQYALLVKADR